MNLSKAQKSMAVAPKVEGAERWITMTNALIRSGHGLTLGEKRIVMLAASKLDSMMTCAPGEVPTTKISAIEYAEMYGIEMNAAYEQLQLASKHLYARSITFFEPAFTRKGKPIEPTLRTMRWVGEVKYQKGEGWVELFWWPQLMPHLIGLKKNFTSYQLQQANALRSEYSWRLLELLMRFKSTGVAEYTIEDFCQSMNATEKQKNDFAKIRTKIIEPAVKELREKDNWILEWEPIKGGRKVKSIRFTFLKNPQQSLPL